MNLVLAVVFVNQAAQGDLLLVRADGVPEGATEREPADGRHILAHSETGHHHWTKPKATRVFRIGTECYLSVSEPTELLHDRSWDTHAPLSLSPGHYRVIRQREHTPEGWQYVRD